MWFCRSLLKDLEVVLTSTASELVKKIWLSPLNIPLGTDSKKLSLWFRVPFKIDKINNSTTVRLKLPKTLRVSDGNREPAPSS